MTQTSVSSICADASPATASSATLVGMLAAGGTELVMATDLASSPSTNSFSASSFGERWPATRREIEEGVPAAVAEVAALGPGPTVGPSMGTFGDVSLMPDRIQQLPQ